MPSAITVRILGSNSALPAHGRFPSSQIFQAGELVSMIDCGEGTQMQLSRWKVKRNRIKYVFISHLHGDHVYGLPGLLSSFNHFSRTDPLTIFGPPGIRSWLEHIFLLSEVHLLYELKIVEIIHPESFPVILKEEDLTVRSFPLIHRVPTLGFRFDHKRSAFNIDPEAIDRFSMTIEEIRHVKSGGIIERGGHPVSRDNLILPQPGPVSYAYCSDTIFTTSIIPFIRGVDLLYHEATYLDDMKDKASETKHSTASEAGQIARLAGVKKLLIGHFSSRYADLSGHLEEARIEFKESHLAREGDVWEIVPG